MLRRQCATWIAGLGAAWRGHGPGTVRERGPDGEPAALGPDVKVPPASRTRSSRPMSPKRWPSPDAETRDSGVVRAARSWFGPLDDQ